MKKEVKKVTQEIDLMELFSRFGSEEKCRAYLQALRFPNGIKCVRCNSDKISRVAKRNQFMCSKCNYQFSPMAGTMFHDTHLPLIKWFAAVYLMCESKKGISANQMMRTLKIGSYRTAWYLCHRIREALKTDNTQKLTDTIEVDETFVGGKISNKHGESLKRAKARPNKNKLITVGALQRTGEIRLKHIPDVGRPVLHEFIRSLISRDTKKIYTDDRTAYVGIDWETGIEHQAVNHSAGEYTRGDIHTNGIENVFSLFKRSIVGSFHHISEKHIDKYLDEFEFKFNNRKNPYMFHDCIVRMLNSENMEYKTLVKTTA